MFADRPRPEGARLWAAREVEPLDVIHSSAPVADEVMMTIGLAVEAGGRVPQGSLHAPSLF